MPPEENDTTTAPETSAEQSGELQKASGLEKADVELGGKLAKHRDLAAVKAAGKAGKIGDQGPLYAISAGLVVVGLLLSDRRLSGSGVAMFAATGLADLGKSAVKRSFSRTRPHVLMDEDRYEKEAHGSARKPEQSFPSGHTACSVAAARALSRNFPEAGAAAGIAAVGIGISRVAKGAHWPLDVLGGAIIGLAAEAVGSALLKLAADSARGAVPPEWVPVVQREKNRNGGTKSRQAFPWASFLRAR